MGARPASHQRGILFALRPPRRHRRHEAASSGSIAIARKRSSLVVFVYRVSLEVEAADGEALGALWRCGVSAALLAWACATVVWSEGLPSCFCWMQTSVR